MWIALACALSLVGGFVGARVAAVLCVSAQQLLLATAAYFIQKPDGGVAPSKHRASKLFMLCCFAAYFSATIPALFWQVATKSVVRLDARNLLFALPVISIAFRTTLQEFFARRRHRNHRG